MFTKLLNFLLGRSTAGSAAAAEPVVQSVSGSLPENRVPQDQMLCIFQQDRLVNFYRDDDPPERQPGESWWLVPRNDVVLTISLEVAEKTYSSDVSVRFEAEANLLKLLNAQQGLTQNDLVALVTSQLAGLLEMLEYLSDGSMLEASSSDQERIRAKLSLVLQNQGLRCTGIGNWQVVEQAPPAEEPTSPEPVEEQDDPESTNELVEAVQQVNEPAQWDGLMATLEAGGCQFDEEAANELDELGQQVLTHNMPAKNVANRLRQLVQQARERAQIPQPDLQRWRGLDMRLEANLPVENDAASSKPGDLPLTVTKKRRPWTWWILSHRGVDDRLLQFLHQNLTHLRGQFDTYSSDKSSQQGLVALRRVDQQLSMALDLLETVPTLSPKRSAVRIDRNRLKPLVRHVEAAVTAIETVQAEIKLLQKLTPGDEDWTESCQAICEALQHLNNHLRQRREVRNSVG